jgi:hypothetical protein
MCIWIRLSDELDYIDLDCYGKRMALDLVWQRYGIASEFLRKERKGENDSGFKLSCTSGQLKNNNFGVWTREGKGTELGYEDTRMDGYHGSTSHMATPWRSLCPQRQSPRPP